MQSLREFMVNSQVAPGDDTYSLRKADGEVYVNKKAILNMGGVEPMVRRLVSIWLALPEYYQNIGWHWYDEVHDFACLLAEVYDLSVWQVAQIIAVLSPQNPWDGSKGRDGNRLCAVKVIDAFFSGGVEKVKELRGWGYAPDFVAKAIIILQGGEINWSGAPKTHRFAMLIADPKREDIVVADTHASRIATGNLGGKYHVVASNAYPMIEEGYHLAAEILGIPAYVLQSGTWQAAADGEMY